MKDFFRILEELDLYDERLHNKSDHIYKLHNNEIEFFGLDQPSKVRSRRRHWLWMNEANEFSQEDYRQLSMRTDERIFMDYNPSHQFHWIYDEVLPRKDCTVIRSTYKDNPFLSEEIVKEIEGYQTKDENYWRIYGLGLRGISNSIVYSHWQLCDALPQGGELVYGLDFGYNHPTALAAVKMLDDDIYSEELLYKSHLTNNDLIAELNNLHISKGAFIFADVSEPARIAEIRLAGYNIQPATKDILLGIDAIKRRNWYITKGSINMQKEVKGYSYKTDTDGKLMEEPVKVRDDLMDAIRYAVYSYQEMSKQFIGFI